IWCCCKIFTYSPEAYCTPRSEWCTRPGGGRRCVIAFSRAAIGSRAASVRSSSQPTTFAKVRVKHHRQVDKLAMYPDVSEVSHPKLVASGQLHPASEIQIDLQVMIGIRGHDEGQRLYGEQVILAHDPSHALVIHQHSATPQFRSDSPVTIAPSVLE